MVVVIKRTRVMPMGKHKWEMMMLGNHGNCCKLSINNHATNVKFFFGKRSGHMHENRGIARQEMGEGTHKGGVTSDQKGGRSTHHSLFGRSEGTLIIEEGRTFPSSLGDCTLKKTNRGRHRGRSGAIIRALIQRRRGRNKEKEGIVGSSNNNI
ncbi:hypothetical protein KP509_17G037600 [Ceratopteris richardii]|uniref:Ribosomal protein L2 n=1 Tax=Ceratopteris richardii TaxID=49495 RepID=A0A8T2SVJ1_CERRI|nr:hypothetical protein KP509_17G037600 [Ceratopteris richardii]